MVTALEAVERYLVPHRIAKLMTSVAHSIVDRYIDGLALTIQRLAVEDLLEKIIVNPNVVIHLVDGRIVRRGISFIADQHAGQASSPPRVVDPAVQSDCQAQPRTQ